MARSWNLGSACDSSRFRMILSLGLKSLFETGVRSLRRKDFILIGGLAFIGIVLMSWRDEF